MPRCVYLIFVVWFVFGPLPPWCAASDDNIPRTWRIGGSVGYLLFLSADKGVPLYSVHVQYPYRPSWTLDGMIGFTQTEGLTVLYRVFSPRLMPRNALRIIPINAGITRHLQPSEGIHIRGYVSAGVSLVTAHTTDLRGENRLGWLLGPSGTLGIEIPAGRMSVDLTFLEFSYYATINGFLRSLDGLVFRTGVGIRL